MEASTVARQRVQRQLSPVQNPCESACERALPRLAVGTVPRRPPTSSALLPTNPRPRPQSGLDQLAAFRSEDVSGTELAATLVVLPAFRSTWQPQRPRHALPGQCRSRTAHGDMRKAARNRREPVRPNGRNRLGTCGVPPARKVRLLSPAAPMPEIGPAPRLSCSLLSIRMSPETTRCLGLVAS